MGISPRFAVMRVIVVRIVQHPRRGTYGRATVSVAGLEDRHGEPIPSPIDPAFRFRDSVAAVAAVRRSFGPAFVFRVSE